MSLRRTAAAGVLVLSVALPAAAHAGNSPSYFPELTPDGRYVVFESAASDLGTGIVNGTVSQVFRHDRTTGYKRLVTLGQDGEPGDNHSNEPQISDDGRYVVYSSGAKNLSTRDHDQHRDVFRFDTVTEATTLVSIRADNGIAVGNSQEPAISADGRYVAFSSVASLVASDTDPFGDVYLRDLQAGTTTRISVPLTFASGHSTDPDLSPDGRYVVFTSSAALKPGVAGTNVYRYDTLTAALDHVAAGSDPSISSDGRYVAYDGGQQIHRKDMLTGESLLMSRYSPPNGAFNGSSQDAPAISPDGQWVAFESDESFVGSHNGMNGNVIDIYVTHSSGFGLRRVTAGSDFAVHHNLKPSLASNGDVAFHTVNGVWNLGDTDSVADVYAGQDSFSLEWISRNTQGAASAPNPPSSLNPLMSGSSQTTVRIAWRDNATNETSFELRHRRFGGDWVYVPGIAPRPGSETVGCQAGELAAGSAQNYCYTVPGLTDGSGYEFQVRARNGEGRSGWTPLAVTRTLFPGEVIRSQSYTTTALGESQLKAKKYTVLGDPVDVRFGNFVYDHTDLRMPGLGPDVEIKRTYNSSVPASGPYGAGWTMSFDSRITVANGVVSLKRSDGRVDRFTSDGNGGWTGDPGQVDRLESTETGGHRLIARNDMTATYDAAGQLVRLADPHGNALAFARDAGLVNEITDAAGRKWSLTYASGRLATVTDPAGRRARYFYNAAGDLTQYENPEGKVTTYAYDANHRLTKVVDARGNTMLSHIYDDAGKVVEQTDARGVTLFEYFASYTLVTDPLGRVTKTEFDPETFRVKRVVDAMGGEKSFAYDAVGRLLKETNQLGQVTSYAYDARGNQTSVTDARGEVTRFEYTAGDDVARIVDPLGGETVFARDARGLVLSKTDPAGHETTYTYDARGQTLGETDASGATTTFAYDAAGNRTSTTDARGEVTTFGYDAAGRLVRTTDPLGRVSTTRFNAIDLPVEEVAFDGGVTLHAYDANGNEVSRTDPLGRVTLTEYDAANQPLRITDARGGVTRLEHDRGGRLVARTAPDGRRTRFQYDRLDRRTAEIRPSGARVESSYDAAGNLRSRTSAGGHVTRYGYDVANRLTSVTEPGGRVTAYGYDDAGQLVSVTDARGHRTTYEYDAAGRRVAVVDPLGGRTVLGLDGVGRPVTITDPAGAVLTNTYDDAGNLLTRSAGGRVESFTYDAAGRRVTATSPEGTLTFTRDAGDRVTALQTPQGTVSAEWDAAGNRTKLTTPGQVLDYAYDELGRLVSVERDGAPLARYAYSAAGAPVIEQLADGTTTNRSYDRDGRLTGLVTRRGGLTLQRIAYALDADGNRVRETSTGFSGRYGYDALGRLTSASLRVTPDAGVSRVRTEELAWTYDDVGNRLTSTRNGDTAEATYDAANRLTSFDGRDVDVDAAGRLVHDGLSGYEYDGFGRLVEVAGRGAATFGHDALGRRVRADGQDLLVDADGSVLAVGGRAQVLGLGRVLDGGSVLHADGLGSVRRALNLEGRDAGAGAFRPFGERLSGKGTFGFTGAPQRGHLVHLQARDYSTELGRFLTPDPAPAVPELPQTANTYAYAVNNPMTLTDPTGRCSICGWFSWAGQQVANAVTQVFGGGAGGAKPAPNPAPASQPQVATKGLAESSMNKVPVGPAVAAGGGNLIGQAGSNAIAAGGGNLIGQAGSNAAGLISDKGMGLAPISGPSLISDNGLGVIARSSSGLIGEAGSNFASLGRL